MNDEQPHKVEDQNDIEVGTGGPIDPERLTKESIKTAKTAESRKNKNIDLAEIRRIGGL